MNSDDLLINFTNEASPKSSETKNMFGSRFLLGSTTETKEASKQDQSNIKNDSLLYQPWWSQPQASSYPGSGTQSPLVHAVNQQNASLQPNSPSQHTVQEEKDILIRKILAHQEVLKRKLVDLEDVRKSYDKEATDCQLLKSYAENLLSSKVVRDST